MFYRTGGQIRQVPLEWNAASGEPQGDRARGIVTLAAMEGRFQGGRDAGVAIIGQPNVSHAPLGQSHRSARCTQLSRLRQISKLGSRAG